MIFLGRSAGQTRCCALPTSPSVALPSLGEAERAGSLWGEGLFSRLHAVPVSVGEWFALSDSVQAAKETASPQIAPWSVYYSPFAQTAAVHLKWHSPSRQDTKAACSCADIAIETAFPQTILKGPQAGAFAPRRPGARPQLPKRRPRQIAVYFLLPASAVAARGARSGGRCDGGACSSAPAAASH